MSCHHVPFPISGLIWALFTTQQSALQKRVGSIGRKLDWANIYQRLNKAYWMDALSLASQSLLMSLWLYSHYRCLVFF